MITIIGGGPAGLAAALAGVKAGAKVRLIEASSHLGGQYWRHQIDPDESTLQDKEFLRGEALRSQVLNHPDIEVLCDAQIWSAVRVEDTITLHLLEAGVERAVETRALILATGAYDRTLPFPGWDIPGVMTPGGVQALLKGSGVLAGQEIVIAGTGPFLLPVAEGITRAGGNLVAFLEAHSLVRWFWHLPVALRNFAKVLEGVRYLRTFASRKVSIDHGYAVISAHANAEGVLESVRIAKIDRRWRVKAGSERTVKCDVAAIGWGFTPDLSIAQSLALQMEVARDGSAVVSVDEIQGTNISGIFAAGEITGIGGADLSITEGSIAGQSAADYLKKIEKATTKVKVSSLLALRTHQRNFANALTAIYSVEAGWKGWLNDETIICRCEEVSLSTVNTAIHDLGATNFRSVKLLTRAGMGACQGRICARSAIEIVSKEVGPGANPGDQLFSNNRPIIAPITLGQLAGQRDPRAGL